MKVKMPMLPVPLEEENVEEFYVDPFEAWRCWNVTEKKGVILLQSVTYKCVWMPREEINARCLNHLLTSETEHTAPDRDHKCGIYAVLTEEQALRWKDWNPKDGEQSRVIGKVKLWGRIYPFTEGFLAEKAYPSLLLVPHDLTYPGDPREIRRELERTYAVPTRLI